MFLNVQNFKLFYTSAGVFIILNTIENYIHYSVGRNIENKDSITKIDFTMPTVADIVKIIIIMLVFAFLQASLTCYFEGCFN